MCPLPRFGRPFNPTSRKAAHRLQRMFAGALRLHRASVMAFARGEAVMQKRRDPTAGSVSAKLRERRQPVCRRRAQTIYGATPPHPAHQPLTCRNGLSSPLRP
jgi:hypothetical protein